MGAPPVSISGETQSPTPSRSRSAAREQVQMILESPLVDPLPDDVLGEMDDILRAADRELEGVGE